MTTITPVTSTFFEHYSADPQHGIDQQIEIFPAAAVIRNTHTDNILSVEFGSGWSRYTAFLQSDQQLLVESIDCSFIFGRQAEPEANNIQRNTGQSFEFWRLIDEITYIAGLFHILTDQPPIFGAALGF